MDRVTRDILFGKPLVVNVNDALADIDADDLLCVRDNFMTDQAYKIVSKYETNSG